MIKALWNVSLRPRGQENRTRESSLVGERVRWTGERLHRGISELQEICFQSERFYASISVMSCFCASLVDRWKNILWTVARRLKARKKTLCFTFSLPSVLNIFTVVNSLVKWLHCQVSRRMRYVLSRTVLFHVTSQNWWERCFTFFSADPIRCVGFDGIARNPFEYANSGIALNNFQTGCDDHQSYLML